MHLLSVRLDVEQAGDDLALGLALLQIGQGVRPVGRVVVGRDFAQAQHRAVVLGHQLHRAGLVIDGDGRPGLDDVQPVHRLVVLAHIVEALGRAGVIVEGHAGADHIQEGRALVQQGRLDQRRELSLVAGEAAGHEGGAELQGQAHEVDRRVVVDLALLGLRAPVGRGGELALGQAVNAVVLDDVDHVDAAPQGVGELAKADGGGIAVAGNAEIDQVPIGEAGSGQHRGHAAVHGVEAVRCAQEIGGSLGRAADARELGDPMRLQVQLEAGLDDRAGDGIVAAAGAERRDRTFIVAVGEAEPIGRQLGMMQLRLGDEGHSAACLCGRPRRARIRAEISLVMNRPVIGVPS